MWDTSERKQELNKEAPHDEENIHEITVNEYQNT
jgi:hypothetical protein